MALSIGEINLIVFDESEYLDSPLDWKTLRIILNFVPDKIPREVYDQLLYRREKHVRLYIGSRLYHLPQRIQRNSFRGCRVRLNEAKKGKKAA